MSFHQNTSQSICAYSETIVHRQTCRLTRTRANLSVLTQKQQSTGRHVASLEHEPICLCLLRNNSPLGDMSLNQNTSQSVCDYSETTVHGQTCRFTRTRADLSVLAQKQQFTGRHIVSLEHEPICLCLLRNNSPQVDMSFHQNTSQSVCACSETTVHGQTCRFTRTRANIYVLTQKQQSTCRNVVSLEHEPIYMCLLRNKSPRVDMSFHQNTSQSVCVYSETTIHGQRCRFTWRCVLEPTLCDKVCQ